MNPKLQAINNAFGLYDSDEKSLIEPIAPISASAVDDTQPQQERVAAEREIAGLERDIEKLPDEVKAPLQDELRREKSIAGTGVPDAQALNSIAQKTNTKQVEENAKDAEKIQQTLGSGTLAIAGLGLLDFSGLGNQVAQGGNMLLQNNTSLLVGSLSPALLFTPSMPPALAANAPRREPEQGVGFTRELANS